MSFTDGSVIKNTEVYFEGQNFVVNKKAAYLGKGANFSLEQKDVPRTNIIKWSTDTKGNCDPTFKYVGDLILTNVNTVKTVTQTQTGFPTYTLKTNLCQMELAQPLTYPYLFRIIKENGTPSTVKIDIGVNAVLSSLVVNVDGVLKQSGYSVDRT